MHDLDPVFESFSYTPELAEVAADIGMADPLAMQSMYIFKQPHIGGEVDCHQDATFLYTEPMSVVGFWFAIEDATLENGCLWAAAGRAPRPAARSASSAPAPTTTTARGSSPLDDTPLPDAARRAGADRGGGRHARRAHGLLPHWSDVNRSPTSRHAYSLHCIERRGALPGVNWLQRPASMPLRSLACGSPRSDAGAVSRPLRAGAEGAAARPPRRRPAPGHRRRAGQRVRLHATCRPPTSASWRRGSTAAPSATTSCSTSRRSPTRSA